jgi:integrase
MRLWFRFVSRKTVTDMLTHGDIDRFRLKMAKHGYAVHSARRVVGTVRAVLRWAHGRELIEQNRIETYHFRVPKDADVLQPGEYTTEEVDAILRQWDPTESPYWRPWAVFILATHAGQRARAILHLRWSNVNLVEGTVTWPGQFQKQGKSLVRPLTWAVSSALLAARWWRTRDRYAGDWVFYTPRASLRRLQDSPTSYQTIHCALLKAEESAGLTHQPYRSLHGGRRHVVSEVIELTGDRMLGLEYVGDVDPKALRSYDRRVPARIAKAAAALDARESATKSARATSDERSTPSESDRMTPVPAHQASPSGERKSPPSRVTDRLKWHLLLRATKCQSTVIDGINSNPRGQLKRVSRADLLLTQVAGAGFEPATFGL